MVGVVSSIFPLRTGTQSTTSLQAASNAAQNAFGPEFILDSLSAQYTPVGAAYGLTGQSITPPAHTPAGQRRIALLDESERLLNAGNPAGGRAAAEKVLKQDLADPTAAYLIGQSYLKEGNYKKAAEFFARSAQNTDSAEVQADLRAAQTLSRGKDETVTQINSLLRQPSTAAEGEKLAAYFLENNPTDADVPLILASHYEAKGDLDNMGTTLRAAIRKVPAENAAPLVKYIEGLTTRIDSVSSYDLLGQANAAAGRLGEAREAFEHALTFELDSSLKNQIRSDLANVYTRIGDEALARGGKDAAQAAYEKALTLNRTDARRRAYVELRFEDAQQALRGGRLSSAMTAFDEARINLPTDDAKDRKDEFLEIFDDLATRFTAAADLRGAIRAYSAAYQTDTTADRKRALADAHDAYGQELLADGKYEAAYKAFREATRLFKDDVDYKAHLADAKSHLA